MTECKNPISDGIQAEMRRYKSANNLSMKAEMDILELSSEPEFYDWLKQTEKDLKSCANAREIKITLKG